MQDLIDLLEEAKKSINNVQNELAKFVQIDNNGEPVQEDKQTPIVQPEGRVVRLSGQNEVYFLNGGKLGWVENVETLNKLGFDLNEVKDITSEEFASYERVASINLVKPASSEPQSAQEATHSMLGYRENA